MEGNKIILTREGWRKTEKKGWRKKGEQR